jgi:hypothetical protein
MYAHLISFDLITLIFHEEFKLQSSSNKILMKACDNNEPREQTTAPFNPKQASFMTEYQSSGKIYIRGLSTKFMDSLYYSESELCGGAVTSLFFKVSPLASDALLTTLHPVLKNMLQTTDHFEISCLKSSLSWLEKPRNRMGRDLDCMAHVLMGFHQPTFSKPNTECNSDLTPCNFWAFPTMKTELQGKKFQSDQHSAAHFQEVGGVL